MTNWSLTNTSPGIELYLAPNFEKLQEMVNIKSTVPPDKVGNTLKELERRANLARLDGDHEMAYVYLMRYVGIAIDAKKRKVTTVTIDVQNLSKMINLADALATSLRLRYEEKQQQKPAPNDGVSQTSQENGADKASGNGQSSKENHEPSQPPVLPNSDPNNAKQPEARPAAARKSSNASSEDIWLNTKQLYALMREGRTSDQLLVIDCRSAEDYAAGHVDFPGTFNVPLEILKPGTACSGIEKQLDSSSKLFLRRNTAKNIVLVDWDSGESDNGKRLPDKTSPVWCMYLALTKWNDRPIVASPKILLKGYNNFLLLYPHCTSGGRNADKAMAVKRQNEIDDQMRRPLQQVTDYPDLESILGISAPKKSNNRAEVDRSNRPTPKIPPRPQSAASPLSQMSIPAVDRTKKPSLATKTSQNAQSLPQQQNSGSDLTPNQSTSSTISQSIEPVVDPKPASLANEANELDLQAKKTLQAELQELEERKKHQLRELAEVMRAMRNATAQIATVVPAVPATPSSSTVVDGVQPTERPKQPAGIENGPQATVHQARVPEVPTKPHVARYRARSHSPPGDKPKNTTASIAPPRQPTVDRSSKPNEAIKRTTPTVAPTVVDESSNNNNSSNVIQASVSEEQIAQPKPFVPQQAAIPTRQVSLAFTDNSADFNALQPVHGPTPSGVAGLRNMGNTCFLASIVQCLAAAPAFSDYYTYSAYKNAVHLRQKLMIDKGFDPSSYRQPVATVEMARLMKAMLSTQFKSLAPRDLKSVIGAKNSSFATLKQQDAQEFLAELLDTLHEEINCGELTILRKIGAYKDAEDEKEPTDEATAWQSHRRHHDSILVGLFHGMYRSTVTCLTCRKQYPKFDAFVYLTLPVPTGERGKITLHDCLASYVYPEFIDGWRCSNCKKPSRVTKKLDIVRAPPLLIIHLNRFAWSGEWRAKIADPVHFQPDNFTLGSRSYSLFAVCNHFGTLEAGHYTATTRPLATTTGRPSSTFFRYDDAEVSSLSASSLVTDERHAASAYLLFYAANDINWVKYRRDLMGAAKL